MARAPTARHPIHPAANAPMNDDVISSITDPFMDQKPALPRFPQAAAIPFRPDGRGGWEVLLIRKRTGKKWGVPKGVVDPGQTPRDTAHNESREEAGVEGELLPEPLGRFQYEKWGGACDVDVFAMRVTAAHETYLEQAVRERRWFPIAEAARTVGRPALTGFIAALGRKLLAGA